MLFFIEQHIEKEWHLLSSVTEAGERRKAPCIVVPIHAV